MPADGKPIHILFDQGMQQELDEFAVPVPGNMRHAINTRTRKGGSIEQRRGVHGFAVQTPSYMANFQATGAVEFVGRIGNSPAFGMAGKAYAHDRAQQFAYYAGEYSQYEPLSKKTAILTENQQGLFGCRQVAIGKDLLGKRYTVIASLGETQIECRVMNSDGHTVASFLVATAVGKNLELFAAEPPYVYLYIRVNNPDAGDVLTLYKIQLGGQVSYTTHIVGPSNSTTELHPLATGAFPVLAGSVPDAMKAAAVLASGAAFVSFEPIRAADDSLVNSLLLSHGGTGAASLDHRFNFAAGKTTESFTVLASTHRTGDGNITYAAMSQASAIWLGAIPGSGGRGVGPTGVLLPSGVGYSAPVISATDDPQRFLWLASNGMTTFGDLVLPSGPPRVRILGTMLGVPLSLMDRQGSHWTMTPLAEVAALPRSARALLVSHPGEVPSLAGYAKPLAKLAAERQLTKPNPFIWDESQVQYSRIAEDAGEHAVMLPVQLRTQGSGLISLEKYTYRHTPSTDFGRVAMPLKSDLLVAGQAVEVYPSPNRVGIGVFSGAPTFAARQLLASEVGFPTEPFIATLAAASGANITPGRRLYSALFEWLSPAGERHRSRPAAPVSFVNTSNTGVQPYVPEDFVSQRFPSPRVHYYRTIDGRKEFRRISPDTGVEPGAQFFDHASDDEIRDNEILYTDGGVQPNDLAPSCRLMALGEDRLWLGGLFESDIIQASKKFVPREPVRFTDHDAFKVRLPFDNTGLAYLEGALVAFCEESCYLVSGDGPNDKGAGGYTLRPIADVGALDHRSILVTSIGVFFQSKRSLQLMPRGFGPPQQIRNLNELMGDFGGGFTEVIGAALHDSADEETARFLLRNPATDQRIVAVYELGTQTWSYDTISVLSDPANDGVASLLTASSAVLLVDFFRSDGFVKVGDSIQSVTNLMTGTVIPNGGSAPQFTAGALGDKPGAVFDGVDDDFLTTEAAVVAALTSNAECTVFAYAKFASVGPIATIVGAGRTDQASASTVRFGDGAGVYEHTVRTDAAAFSGAVFAETQDTRAHLLTYVHSATGTRLWIDGVESTSGEETLVVGTLTPHRVSIGSRPGSTKAFFFGGALGLVAIVPSALGNTARQAIDAAILAKAEGNLSQSASLTAIGDGPEGVIYGAGSGAHRIMTELDGVGGTPYDSMGSTVNRFWSEVRMGRFQAFGPAGEGKLKAMQLRGYSPATGAQVNLSVVSDYGTLTHTYNGIGSGTFFRRAVAGPNDASASEAQVSATFRTGVGQKHGLRLLSLTLELEPTQGLRRARIGEQD